MAFATVALAVLVGTALPTQQQDKYSLKVPGGLAFAEFRGYEDWAVVAVHATDDLLKVVLANPEMMNAYRAGIPRNGKAVPDGGKMAKVEWRPRRSTEAPYDIRVPGTVAMAVQTANLLLLEDLDDASKTRELANSDLAALRTVADWIKSFVTRPHKDLGRDGPVCPFVGEALERKALWLASEHTAGLSVADVVQLINGYKTQFLHAQPVGGEGATYKSTIVVFTDLSADRAKGLFDDVLNHLAVPSYVEDGLVIGGFYQNNEGTAVYNRDFRPFMSPVPFLLMRHAVISDWKFFLDNDDWLNRWAHRYEESVVRALGVELRRLPWRARRD